MTKVITTDENIYLSDFFKAVAKGVKKFGVKTILGHIQNLGSDDKFRSGNIDIIIDYIFDCIIEEWSEYNLTKDKLFEATKRGEPPVARKMAIIVMRLNLKASDSEISMYFGKSRQVSWRAYNEFKNMKKSIPSEKKFLEKFERIDSKVKLFIQKLKEETSHNNEQQK